MIITRTAYLNTIRTIDSNKCILRRFTTKMYQAWTKVSGAVVYLSKAVKKKKKSTHIDENTKQVQGTYWAQRFKLFEPGSLSWLLKELHLSSRILQYSRQRYFLDTRLFLHLLRFEIAKSHLTVQNIFFKTAILIPGWTRKTTTTWRGRDYVTQSFFHDFIGKAWRASTQSFLH